MFDWITAFLEASGYFGIAFLMFIENVFPPIPSGLVMRLAGFNGASGAQTRWGVILAGTIGSVSGALFWYWVGRRIGEERIKRLARKHGRWLTLHPVEITQVSEWFDRHGRIAVLIGRLVPTIRTLISVPAGVARMPLRQFMAWSTIGTAVWTGFLSVAGYLLESQYERVQAWLNPVSTAVVLGILGYYLFRVWRFDGARRSRA